MGEGARRPRGTLALIWLGTAITAMVVWLGLVTPFDHPARTRVDNALLLVGGLGVANALLLVRTRLIPMGAGARVALAGFALVSTAAVAVTDFGAFRTGGWVIKGTVVVVMMLTLKDLAVGNDG